jgi:hypothetical protein
LIWAIGSRRYHGAARLTPRQWFERRDCHIEPNSGQALMAIDHPKSGRKTGVDGTESWSLATRRDVGRKTFLSDGVPRLLFWTGCTAMQPYRIVPHGNTGCQRSFHNVLQRQSGGLTGFNPADFFAIRRA